MTINAILIEAIPIKLSGKREGVKKVGLHFLIEDWLTMGLEITDDDLNLSYILDKQFQLVFQIFQSCTHFSD